MTRIPVELQCDCPTCVALRNGEKLYSYQEYLEEFVPNYREIGLVPFEETETITWVSGGADIDIPQDVKKAYGLK